MTVQNLLFCAYTLCMNYVTNMFLLVSSSVRSKQLLCFLHGQGQKVNKNLQQRPLLGFITILLYRLCSDTFTMEVRFISLPYLLLSEFFIVP